MYIYIYICIHIHIYIHNGENTGVLEHVPSIQLTAVFQLLNPHVMVFPINRASGKIKQQL